MDAPIDTTAVNMVQNIYREALVKIADDILPRGSASVRLLAVARIRGLLADPARIRGFDPVAVSIVRTALDRAAVSSPSGLAGSLGLNPANMAYYAQAHQPSDTEIISESNSFWGKLGNAWVSAKNWLWGGVQDIYKAGQMSVTVQQQQSQVLDYAASLYNQISQIISGVRNVVGGAAVSTGISAVWSTTVGKIAILGGGFLLVRMFTKR